MSSFPVPVSPWIRTVVSVPVTRPEELQDVFHFGAAVDDALRADPRFPTFLRRMMFSALQSFVGDLEFGRQPFVFAHQFHLLQRFPHGQAQFVRLPGLGDVFVDFAGVDGRDEVVDLGVAGQNDPDQVRDTPCARLPGIPCRSCSAFSDR